jgi:hypothetical protein
MPDPASSPAEPQPRPRGRRPGPVRTALGWILAMPVPILAGAWLTGRIVGDRFLWSQYPGWMPTELVALAALGLTLLALLSLGRKSIAPRAALAVSACLLAWLLFVEWSLWRALAPGPERGELRVAFANISPERHRADLAPLFDAGADILILSNVHPNRISFERIYGFRQQDLLEVALGITPDADNPAEIHFLRQSQFRVMSRRPLRRYAWAGIAPQESWLETDTRGGGAILMLEFADAQGPLVIWAVDMPSTLGASRKALFAEAARRIDEVRVAMEPDAIGRWNATPIEADDRLFSPDLVLGDFNTPGHAWSVADFTPGLRPLRADAGLGPAGTWPAPWPLFEIDLIRLAPSLRGVAAGRIRIPGGRHLGLWCDLRRR